MRFRGEQVQRLRLRKGWSTEDLGRRVDLTRQAILNIEKGGVDPRAVNAKAIADALEVDIDDLYEQAS